MGRKRVLDTNSCKLTLYLTGDNKGILDNLTSNYKFKYGPMINKIIDTFCRMPEKNRKVIENICVSECEFITTLLKNTPDDLYHREALEREQNYYIEILNLINGAIYKEELNV